MRKWASKEKTPVILNRSIKAKVVQSTKLNAWSGNAWAMCHAASNSIGHGITMGIRVALRVSQKVRAADRPRWALRRAILLP
jgi:hypothetical protein